MLAVSQWFRQNVRVALFIDSMKTDTWGAGSLQLEKVRNLPERIRPRMLVLNGEDPASTPEQAVRIVKGGFLCGMWFPVARSGERGADYAARASAAVSRLEAPASGRPAEQRIELVVLDPERSEKVTTLDGIDELLWGYTDTVGNRVKGWRGRGGTTDTPGVPDTYGWRQGRRTVFAHEPDKDGTVMPLPGTQPPRPGLREARIALATELFYGPHGGLPDMAPCDEYHALVECLIGWGVDWGDVIPIYDGKRLDPPLGFKSDTNPGGIEFGLPDAIRSGAGFIFLAERLASLFR